MRLDADELRDKALLVLEDAVAECHYGRPRRSFAVRFALAYLWAYSGAGCRKAYDHYWSELCGAVHPWSLQELSHAMLRVYAALGLDRPDDIHARVWARRQREQEID